MVGNCPGGLGNLKNEDFFFNICSSTMNITHMI
jgi:hypothetical protein